MKNTILFILFIAFGMLLVCSIICSLVGLYLLHTKMLFDWLTILIISVMIMRAIAEEI